MPAARTTLGRRSVWLAAITLICVIAATWQFAAVPKTAPEVARDVSVWVFMIAVLAAPVSHIVGFVMGLAALVRGNDSRILGILGAVLNGLFVVGVLLFVWFMMLSMSRFR